MKISKVYINFIVLVVCCIQIIYGQVVEQDEYKKLNNLLNYINSMNISTVDNAKAIIQKDINICPGLDTLVNVFYDQRSKYYNETNNKINKRQQLNLSENTISVSGIVESKEMGYSIINSDGHYYAVKFDLTIGQNFSGSLKQISGTIKYKPLGGGTYNVQTFEPVQGSSPKETYRILTNQIDELNRLQNELWDNFKKNCQQILKVEIEKRKDILIEEHYAKGDNYLNKKDYESAYKEFQYVQSIDENYKDIKQKVELSNNKNNVVGNSTVYNIINTGGKHFLISTSSGIYESTDEGKIWKLKGYEGYNIKFFDAVKDRLVAEIPGIGIMSGIVNRNGAISWNKVIIKYTAIYNYVDDKNYRKYEMIHPDFNVKQIKFIPYKNDNILFIKFERKAGMREKGKWQAVVKENQIWSGLFYIEVGNDVINVAETCLSPDYGQNWVAYWGTLLGGDHYFTSKTSYSGIEDMIDITEEYLDRSEDATDVVKEYIADKYKIDEDVINILDHSYIKNKELQDDDIILVLTDFGLYKSCYDCDKVEEIVIPKEYAKPVSLFYDNKYPNLIMVGLMGQGVIISRDKGLTWESNYADNYSDRIDNQNLNTEATSSKIEINYLKSGNKWTYEVENIYSGDNKQKFNLIQKISGDIRINNKLYKELEISFEGISVDGQKYYYRYTPDAIYAALEEDRENEYLDMKLPLSLNLEWESKSKVQNVTQKVIGLQSYTFNGIKYENCYKIFISGEYYDKQVNGYQIYNYDIGYLYSELNYPGAKQIIQLKEFSSN